MSDRRKARRFAFATPARAQFHLLQDVVIERSAPDGLTVLAAESSVPGERLAVRIRGTDEQVVTLAVQTIDSRPVMVDGSGLRYRLRLQVVEAEGAGAVAREVP
jgi:hypothetical protein